MIRMKTCLLLTILVAGTCVCSESFGQLRGSLGGGMRGRASGIRSGSGFRNNPIANPAPTLTPNQIFNPRGSLSTGQVRNPAPSLSRPRAGVSTSRVNRIDPAGSPVGQGVRTFSTQSSSGLQTDTPSAADRRIDSHERKLKQQVQRNAAIPDQRQSELELRAAVLEQVLKTYPNGEKWVRYFGLTNFTAAQLEGADAAIGLPELQTSMQRFKKISSDPRYERVTSLQAFEDAQAALEACIAARSCGDVNGASVKPQALSGAPAPAASASDDE